MEAFFVLEFKVPQMEDKEWIDPLLQMSDYMGCGYTFGNIFSWKENYNAMVAKEDDTLFIKSGSDDDFSFAYPAGKFDIKKAFDIMINYCCQKNVGFSLYGVTEEQKSEIEKVFPGRFEFEPDRSFFDYIYLSKNLIELAGKKFHGKRNHISKFNRLYTNWKYERINGDNLNDCREMAKKWFEKEIPAKDGIEPEIKALELAFDNFEALGYVGGLIRIDGEVAAFTMGERLNSNTFCSHFEKALPEYIGAYTVINNEFAKNELSAYKYINREEDMGIEGLRKAKLSYNPDILLEKYVVRGK